MATELNCLLQILIGVALLILGVRAFWELAMSVIGWLLFDPDQQNGPS